MRMLFDFARLRGGVDRVSRTDDPSAFDLAGEDFRLVAPVAFEADVRKDAEKVRLVGRVQTTIEATCSRCVEPFAIPVDSAFDLLFLPASAESQAGEREIDDAAAGVSYYRDEVIDLAEIIREQLFLALPMKPLCQESCQGLCPICGANRNQTPCTCAATWVDPRMSPLAKLRGGQS
jgi:uncharacterized protein